MGSFRVPQPSIRLAISHTNYFGPVQWSRCLQLRLPSISALIQHYINIYTLNSEFGVALFDWEREQSQFMGKY